ncbi:MAG TPA: histidine kinase, partial [Ferruginibacter sp.]|nr:histidine kinase [Ferruginibacter sp.]
MRFIIYFFLAELLFAPDLRSQPRLTLTQWNESRGLSDNQVNCLYKDQQGFVWVGTADGLNRLDGSQPKRFFHDPKNSYSLPSNQILSLFEDGNRQLWIGTGEGFCRFEPETQTFKRYRVPASALGASNLVNSIASANNRALWIATDGGLFLFDIQTEKFQAILNTTETSTDHYRYSNNILRLFIDSRQQTWICSKDGCWKLKNNRHFQRITGLPGKIYHPLCMTVFESSDHKIWIGNWEYGLQQVDAATDSVIMYHSLPGAVKNVSAIQEYPLATGGYLLLLNGPLQAFDPQQQRFIQLPKPAGWAEWPDVSSFHYSTDGWLWLGTRQQGLLMANPQAQLFQQLNWSGNITSQSVILKEWKNSLLVGGEHRSVLKQYNDSLRETGDFYPALSLGHPQPEATLSLALVNETEWWIGSTGGLIRFDPRTGKTHRYTHQATDSTSLPANFITHLMIDRSRRTWLFPWRQGIWQFDPLTETATRKWSGFIHDGDQIKKLVIVDAVEDTSGNIWMADLDEGVILYQPATQSFSKPFERQLGSRNHCSRIAIYRNTLYSFTDNQLLHWTSQQSLERISLPAGMNKTINDLAIDSSGRIWLTGKSGLICYQPASRQFKRFNSSDGLMQANEEGMLFVKSNGSMLLATPASLIQFQPDALLQSNQTAVRCVLTGLWINNQWHVLRGNRLDLDHEQNNLLFQWALPSFNNPDANQYYCRLTGIDSSWRLVGNKGEIQYAQLAPGDYQLQLKAISSNGIPSINTLQYQIKIIPPWWQRNWIQWTFVTSIVLLIALFARNRIRSVKRKAALQKTIGELEMKALRAQMNPHFIFNSLNSIQECILTKDTDNAYRYLSQFSKLVRRILENSGKATVPLNEELELMQWYLNLEQLRFSDPIHVIIQNKFSDPVFEIPSMVMQPFIENALWHGLATKEGEKCIRILIFESRFRVNIVI